MKKILFIFLTLLIVPGTGCLEFHEVVELKADGTAQLTLQIKLPDIAKKKKDPSENKDVEAGVQELMGGLSKAFKLEKNITREEFGIATFQLVVSIPSLNEVKELYRQVDLKEKEGKKEEVKKSKDEFEQLFVKGEHFKIKRSKEGTLKITRTFTPPKAGKAKPSKAKKGDKESENLNQEIEDAVLNAFYFTFEFLSPTEVKSSNAQWVVGNTYRWETTLGYLVKNPFTMEIEIAETPELSAGAVKK